MAYFRPYKILQSQLASLPIREGQLILVKDTKNIYLDISASSRIQMYSDEIARIVNLENGQYSYEFVQSLPSQNIDSHTVYIVRSNVGDEELQSWLYKDSHWYNISGLTYSLSKSNGNLVLTAGNGDNSTVAISEFSSEAQTKLNGIAANAQVNTIETIQKNGADIAIDNKTVNITVPTSLSQLSNDNNTVTDANYTHTDNNYTNADKNKLASLAADDKTWNGVTLNGSTTIGTSTHYIPAKTDTVLGGDAYMLPASHEPNRSYIAKYDTNSYLHSARPAVTDNSTKVITSAFACDFLTYGFAINLPSSVRSDIHNDGQSVITDTVFKQKIQHYCQLLKTEGVSVNLQFKESEQTTEDGVLKIYYNISQPQDILLSEKEDSNNPGTFVLDKMTCTIVDNNNDIIGFFTYDSSDDSYIITGPAM